MWGRLLFIGIPFPPIHVQYHKEGNAWLIVISILVTGVKQGMTCLNSSGLRNNTGEIYKIITPLDLLSSSTSLAPTNRRHLYPSDSKDQAWRTLRSWEDRGQSWYILKWSTVDMEISQRPASVAFVVTFLVALLDLSKDGAAWKEIPRGPIFLASRMPMRNSQNFLTEDVVHVNSFIWVLGGAGGSCGESSNTADDDPDHGSWPRTGITHAQRLYSLKLLRGNSYGVIIAGLDFR